MRWRSLLVTILVVLGAGVCVRLGVWQLGRWREKQAINRAMRASLAGPARPLHFTAHAESLVGHPVEARGRFDERTQVLLGPRTHDGSPGVEVVTPLVIAEGRAVLVNRGWLYSGDASWARPQDYPDQSERRVRGIAEAFPARGRSDAMRRRDEDRVVLLSTRQLDRDSLEARMPYTLATVVIRELPGPGVPPRPARAAPRPANESMHLGYAVQWFVFALIAMAGPVLLAVRRRAAPRP